MTDEREQAKPWFRKHWTVLVGLLLILIGFALILLFDPNSFVQKLLFGFIIEVGFAFTIAWGVGLTVEQGARREYNEYVQEKGKILSKNVFGYLYSVSFPRTAFKVMEDHIFSQPIVKTRQILDVELFDPRAGSDWVRMRCEFDYTIKNLSEKSVQHPVRFHASKVSGLNEPKDDTIGLQSMIIDGKAVPQDQFPDMDKAAENEIGQQKFEKTISIASNQEIRIQVTFFQHKRVNDNDLWTSNSVCEGLELKFRYNPEVFDVFIEPVHPSGKFKSDLGPNGGDNCRRVTITEALLPKNGVFMWWNKRDVVALRKNT